jgi:hypothetical protein
MAPGGHEENTGMNGQLLDIRAAGAPPRDARLADLDAAILASLRAFNAALADAAWFGDERETISLYAFGHLIRECGVGRRLFDPAQVGIEVAVPDTRPGAHYATVWKDIVIWPEPGMTCYAGRIATFDNLAGLPLAVLEWKKLPRPWRPSETRVNAGDLTFLTGLAAHCARAGEPFIGYLLTIDTTADGRMRQVRGCSVEPGDPDLRDLAIAP